MQFKEFGKIPRLYRRVTISEKIDGTNAAVGIEDDLLGQWETGSVLGEGVVVNVDPARSWLVYAQSRNRIITPEQDNHGFARWVRENATELAIVLGTGLHFGEWWGSGIQRGYGLQKGEKRFSLFNTKRWTPNGENALADGSEALKGLGVVPVIYDGMYDESIVAESLHILETLGSKAAPGFFRPEGIIIYHTAGGYYTKVTFNGDGNKGMDGR